MEDYSFPFWLDDPETWPTIPHFHSPHFVRNTEPKMKPKLFTWRDLCLYSAGLFFALAVLLGALGYWNASAICVVVGVVLFPY